MRLRATVPVVSAALLLTVAGSAFAAQGDFIYQVGDRESGAHHLLVDPPGRGCVRLPLPDPREPAHHVDNRTDSTAVVFLDERCQSDVYYVVPAHSKAPAGVLARSVSFSS
ncbi:hypothetical protein [Saccharopolyspora taberi]|uniref:Uncharacterized protein n=1 Tax=Saccharopolyspora taberi TaxID=60895 RepID=A0ABN3VCN7_9PSEU